MPNHQNHEDKYFEKIPPPSTIFEHFKLFLYKTYRILIYSPETLDDMVYTQGEIVLSKRAVGVYGITKRVALFSAFITLFVFNFITLNITQKFVALSSTAGNCEEIPKPWTIDGILADRNGYWSGQNGFQSNQACYEFSIFNFETNIEEYKIWLKTIDVAIQSVGELAKSQDLGTNLLYWSSWAFSSPTNSSTGPVEQTVILTGSPRYIMNNENIQGTISNVHSDCDLTASSQSYDVATATISTIFDMSPDGIGSYPLCQGIINAKLLGWNPMITGNTFAINIDVIALFTALAVAERVNGPTTLDRYVTFTEVSKAVWTDGVEYSIVDKYDPGYPGMAPVTCVGPTNGSSDQWNCLLRIGSSYGIPFLTDRGANATFPEKCDCTSENGNSTICDNFNLLLGLIVFDHKSNPALIAGYPEEFQPIIPFLEVFYVPPLFPAKSANRLSFYPAFAAMFGQNSTVMQSVTWRSDMYSFTSTSFGTGSFIIINSFSNIQSGVTADNLQLDDGACADQITTKKFYRFYDNRWGPLVESYYQCTMSFSDAVLNAAGIASGTAGLIVPMSILFLMYMCMGLGALRMLLRTSSSSKENANVEIVVVNHEVDRKEDPMVDLVEVYPDRHSELSYSKVTVSSPKKKEKKDLSIKFADVSPDRQIESSNRYINMNIASPKKEDISINLLEVYPDRYDELSLLDLDGNHQSNNSSISAEKWIPGLSLIGLAVNISSPSSPSFGTTRSEFLQYQLRRRKELMSDRRYNTLSQEELSALIVNEYNTSKNIPKVKSIIKRKKVTFSPNKTHSYT